MFQKRGWIGLNLVNFFLAAMSAVIGPYLALFLRSNGWSYGRIGAALAMGGVATLLFQTAAGYFADRLRLYRAWLGGVSLLVGLSFGSLPWAANYPHMIYALLFIAAAGSTLIGPLLASLGLMIAGQKDFGRITGENQSYNHAGNIAAALLALVLVKASGVSWLFGVMASMSVLASASLVLIRPEHLQHPIGRSRSDEESGVKSLLSDPQVLVLLAAIFAINTGNTPSDPLLGLYVKSISGHDAHVAYVLLIAQTVMIPVALIAARLVDTLGRKWVCAFGFLCVPIKLFLFSATRSVPWLLGIQALGGVSTGIYGVVVALIASDIARKRGNFNLIMGLAQTALGLGGIVGPLLQGAVTERYGFAATFDALAACATLGAAIYLVGARETRDKV